MKLEKLLPWNANAPPHRETICETRNRPLFHTAHKKAPGEGRFEWELSRACVPGVGPPCGDAPA